MKKAAPIIVMILLGAALVGSLWYGRSQFMVTNNQELTTQTNPEATLTGKTVTDAATTADSYVRTLKKNGSIPVTSDGLGRDPKPLFQISN